MSRRGACILGVVVFAVGGAVLAYGGDAGVVWGTICGVVGLGLIAWGVLRRPAA
jgi:hypothetical protein